jgi:hypothetical protein
MGRRKQIKTGIEYRISDIGYGIWKQGKKEGLGLG